jgi:hypothetical protein
MVTPKGSMSTEGETLPVSVLPYSCSICAPLVTYRSPDKRFSHTLDSLGRWPRPTCPFRRAQSLCCNFMYHSRIVLSVAGSVRYTVRNLLCIVTMDSVMANSKTQNAFLFPVHAMFRHDCSIAVKYASTPQRLVHKYRGEIINLLICSFLLCLS